MSVQKMKAFEDESFEVCVHINGTLSQDITVYLNSADGSAIGKHHLDTNIVTVYPDQFCSRF